MMLIDDLFAKDDAAVLCYDGGDSKVNGSTPILASLRVWIRCFTIIILAWWNLTSSKLKKSEAKLNRKKEEKTAPKRI